MKRYRIINGVPVAPPRSGVSVDGKLISNFAGRIEHDTAFAAANGYYPIAEGARERCEAGCVVHRATYRLENGQLVRTVEYER